MVIGSYRVTLASVDPRRYMCWLTLITSLLNHGIRSRRLQILDRCVIASSAVMYTYTYRDLEELYLLYSAIACYFLSKVTGYVCFHVWAHGLVILLHNKVFSNHQDYKVPFRLEF